MLELVFVANFKIMQVEREMMMQVHIMQVGFIGTNCYILSKGEKAIVIDPGGDSDKIIDYIDENKLEPEAILLTHAHYDHIGALEEVRDKFGVNVYIHELEQNWLVDPKWNGSYKLPFGTITASEAEKTLKEGELEIGPFQFEVIHTPGHSPGSMSFVFNDTKQVFSGDVLFNQGIGRTDLPGGDFPTLEQSIREKLYHLADDFEVFPGHGPSTTIGFEKKNNPFFQA